VLRRLDCALEPTKTKKGYGINFNRYSYEYVPPRSLAEIETDIRKLEGEIAAMLKEVL